MYSFGMTDRDIKAHLEKIYNVEVHNSVNTERIEKMDDADKELGNDA
jgi:ribosomal protein L23